MLISFTKNLRDFYSNIRFAFRFFNKPFIIFPILLDTSLKRNYVVSLRTKLRIALRPSRATNVSDLDILKEILWEDQYMLSSLIRDGDTVVDIGAHIGIFSILAAHVCRRGEVLSFEPEQSNFTLLQKNTLLNPELPIKIYNWAISNEQVEKQLYLSKANSGAHSLLGKGENSQLVQCIRLSEIISMLHKKEYIDLLKIDCEGGEYDIILGATRDDLLRIRQIVMEVHQTEYTKPDYLAALYDKMLSYGFSLRTLKTITYADEGVFYIVVATRIQD